MIQNLCNYVVNLSNAPSLFPRVPRLVEPFVPIKQLVSQMMACIFQCRIKLLFLHSINRHHLNVFMLVNFGEKTLNTSLLAYFLPKIILLLILMALKDPQLLSLL